MLLLLKVVFQMVIFDQTVEQPLAFPGYLLVQDIKNMLVNANIIIRYNFIMPFEHFKSLLEPLFEQQSTTCYREQFLDIGDGILMELGYWIKILREHHEDTRASSVSIKHTIQNGKVYKKVMKELKQATNE